MPPKDKKNCKGLPAGTGTVSNTRRQQFKDKGKRRELANMEACDKKLNDGQWQSFYKLEKNRKARKLTEEEVNFFLLSPEEKEKYLAKKKQVEEEAKKGQLAKEEESTFDKRVDAASGFKSEVAGSVDKTLPSSSKGVKEEILTPALADWENVKKKLLEKKLEKERRRRRRRKQGRQGQLLELRALQTGGTCPPQAAQAPAAPATKLEEKLLLTKEKQKELLPKQLKVLLTKENLRPARAVAPLTKRHQWSLHMCLAKR